MTLGTFVVLLFMKSFLHSATFKSLWSPPAFLGTSHGDEDEMGEDLDEE